MTFALMSLIEILLFNMTLVFIYQPEFIFRLLKLNDATKKKFSYMMLAMGLVSLCILFGWSFYMGATLFIYKQSLM